MIATPPIPSVFREATITHLDLPSTCVHQDSAEGAAQLQKEREENNKFRRKSTMAEANAEDFDAAKEKERKKKKVKSKISHCLKLQVSFISYLIHYFPSFLV